MTRYILFDEHRFELLDQMIPFAEGMSILMEHEGVRKSYRVERIITVLQLVGDKLDAINEIQLR